MKATNASGLSKCKATLRLAAGKWRLQAFHAGDAEVLAGSSARRTVVVR